MSYQLIVVGGGIAGACAALRAVQNGLRTLVLLGDRRTAKASRVKYVYNIDNMMGLHAGLMTEKYASLFTDIPAVQQRIREARFHLDTQSMVDHTWARLRAEYADLATLVPQAARTARRTAEGFEVSSDTDRYLAPHLVLATGVTDRQPEIRKRRGEKIVPGIQWVYPFANHESFLYCIRCEGHLVRKSSCAVIGSSEAAAQVALMLHERYGVPVCLVTHGEELAAGETTRRLLDAYGIRVHTSAIQDIKGAMAGRVLSALVLEDGTVLSVRYAMVAMGLYRVFNDLARELGAELESEGPPEVQHVLVDARGETTVPNLFAVGDMARRRDEPVMKQVYTAQEYAVRAVDTIDRRVRLARREALLASS